METVDYVDYAKAERDGIKRLDMALSQTIYGGTSEQVKRTRAILKRLFPTKADARAVLDKDADWTSVQGIGVVRAPIAKALVRETDEHWDFPGEAEDVIQ